MADQSISELISATQIQDTDLFLLEQGGDAKSLAGRVLLNWLTAAADGHGGIQSIAKLSSSGLTDTYRITLADTTTVDFTVTNGRGIRSIAKSGSSGLVDTYQVSYTDGSSSTITVTNGAKGDKGDNAYTWIKYASQQPTAASHSMGDIPDTWMGIYTGTLPVAPTDWKQYKWYKIKGEKGDIGIPATLVSTEIVYQSSDSGTIIPSGAWSTSIPVVAQGKYLWKRTTRKFNSGEPEVSYDVNRMGIDGSGSVSSVAGMSPDATGNVTLTAADVDALAVSGGDVTGEIRMNGQPISGLNDPTEDTQAARKGYVDAAKTAANSYTDASVRKAAHRNLLDNSDFSVAQAGYCANHGSVMYAADRWKGSGSISFDGDVATLISDKDYQGIAQYLEPAKLRKIGTVWTLAFEYKATKSLYARLCTYSNKFIDIKTAFPPAASEWTPCILSLNFTNLIDGRVEVVIENGKSGATAQIRHPVLYPGIYTAETLPEYQPKSYAAELAECQRYYYRRNFFCVLHPANKSNLSEYRGEITFPVEMRTNPQCAFDQSEGNVVTGPVNNQFCLLIGTPNESGWCTTGSRLEFIADL